MGIDKILNIGFKQQRYKNGIMSQLQKSENNSIFDGAKRQRFTKEY